MRDVEGDGGQRSARKLEFRGSARDTGNFPLHGYVARMPKPKNGDLRADSLAHKAFNVLPPLPTSNRASNRAVLDLQSIEMLGQRSSKHHGERQLVDRDGGAHQTVEAPIMNNAIEGNGIIVFPYMLTPNCYATTNPTMVDVQLSNSFFNSQGILSMWYHVDSGQRGYIYHGINKNLNNPSQNIMKPKICQVLKEPLPAFGKGRCFLDHEKVLTNSTSDFGSESSLLDPDYEPTVSEVSTDSSSALESERPFHSHEYGHYNHALSRNPPRHTSLGSHLKTQQLGLRCGSNTAASMEHLQTSQSSLAGFENDNSLPILSENLPRPLNLPNNPQNQPNYPSQQSKDPLTFEHLQELAAKLEGIDNSIDEMEPPPGYMKDELYRHQRMALYWMIQRENEGSEPLGGILADDQGLGKTVTTISLILSSPRAGVQNCKPSNVTAGIDDDRSLEPVNESARIDCRSLQNRERVEVVDLTGSTGKNPSIYSSKSAYDRTYHGGTLIVCPKTVLHQWAKEIRDKTTKEAGCTVYTYHGESKNMLPKVLGNYTVVLTTYGTLVSEMPEHKKPDKKQSTGVDDPMTSPETNENPCKRQKIVIDDKGPLYRIQWHRLVLDEAQEIKNHRTDVAHAACEIEATTRWCLSGTPLQNSIDDLYSYFKFLRLDTLSNYGNFVSLIRDPISCNNPEIRESGFRRLHAYLVPILLRRTKSTKIDDRPIVELPERRIEVLPCNFNEKERMFYCKLESEVQLKVRQMQEDGSLKKCYLNMLWMCLRLRQACNHPKLVRNLKQGKNSILQEEIKALLQLSKSKRESLLKCLEDTALECVSCLDPADDPVISKCCHVFCRQCVSKRLSDASQGNLGSSPSYRCPSCAKLLGSRDTYGLVALYNLNGNAENFLKLGNEDNVDELHMQDSSKIRALMKLLKSLRKDGEARIQESASKRSDSVIFLSEKSTARGLSCGTPIPASGAPSTPPPEKAIVFSQWTSMLDIVEESLRENKFLFRRLDGTMSVSARQKAIEEFTNNNEVIVILVSLKAASLGVNLVSANHVILLDPWYNPSVEEQAIDRAHRIGQKRPVNVTRMTVEGTIEDRILQLQEKKRKLADAAYGNGDLRTAVNKLTINDLCTLFNVS